MDSIERVLCAAKRKPGDGKLPVCFHFADKETEWKYADAFGIPREDFMRSLGGDVRDAFLIEDIQLICSDPVVMNKAYELGFARPSSLMNAAVDSWGCAWSVKCLGQILRSSPIADMQQVYDFKYPDPDRPNVFYGAAEALDAIHADGRASFIAQYYTLFERAWALTGYENFLTACYTDEDEVDYLLDQITENKIKTAEKICALKPTLGHTGDDFGLQRGGVMSLELFKRFFKPRYEKIWGVYRKHGIPVMHHSCGDCSMYVGEMIDAGLDMLHTVQQTCMNIDDLAREYGRDISFFASIDTVDILANGSPDDVRRNVDRTVSVLGKYNGLLLSMINIMPNAPVENVKAAVEQINTYR